MSPSGHAYVEVFVAGGAVDDEHALIDGDALGAVNGDGRSLGSHGL
jgi:hypothetical protein